MPPPSTLACRDVQSGTGSRRAKLIRPQRDTGYGVGSRACAPTSSTTRSSPTSSPRCATSAPTPRRSAASPTSWSRCWPTRPPATSRVDPHEIVTPVAPTTGRQAGHAEAARRPDPAGRARHARRDDAAAADRGGRVPRHGAQRGDARGVDVRRAAARRPVRPPVLRARPDARHRRHPRRSDQVPHRPRRRRHHRDLPARRARGLRAAGAATSTGSTSRSPWSPPRWTRSSTRRATSCPASATPATGSTASSATDPRQSAYSWACAFTISEFSGREPQADQAQRRTHQVEQVRLGTQQALHARVVVVAAEQVTDLVGHALAGVARAGVEGPRRPRTRAWRSAPHRCSRPGRRRCRLARRGGDVLARHRVDDVDAARALAVVEALGLAW